MLISAVSVVVKVIRYNSDRLAIIFLYEHACHNFFFAQRRLVYYKFGLSLNESVKIYTQVS